MYNLWIFACYRVLEQHKISKEEWEENIVNRGTEHKNLFRVDAMMNFLLIAQDLDMYGINYFDIENKIGMELCLGMHALGNK